MNPVVWFEIPVTDMTRAKAFYEKVLTVSLTLHDMAPIFPSSSGPLHMAWFPMENEAPGATGSLVQGERYMPSRSGILIYFSVEDISGVLEKAGKSGGKILNPKMGIGEYGFIGHFMDSEGNCIGLHSMK
jgi:predicted enzyme related to lactoylglutathione lyase